MTKLIVSSLSIYPVKSCREVSQNSSFVEDFGLQNDRRWMAPPPPPVMITQRKLSKMCLIQPELTASGLILNTSVMDPISINIPNHNKKCSVKVWADQCHAFDAGDEAANWLSHVLEKKCRLVYFPEDEIRQVDLEYANKGDKTAFSDGFPLLIISQGSLDDLNQRLSSPIAMNRFRPNIVIDGCNPFAEDEWEKIRIGDITFRFVKPCSRCVIPSINIDTAEREEEPIKTLLSYRKRDKKIFFGQNVIAESNGQINVGMPIEIID